MFCPCTAEGTHEAANQSISRVRTFLLIYTELKCDPKSQATTVHTSRTKQTTTKALKTKQRTKPVANFC